MTKPNLASVDAYGLEIGILVDLSIREIRKMFGKQYSPEYNWQFIAYQEYTISRHKHYCFVGIHHLTATPKGKKKKLHLDITFGVGEKKSISEIKNKLPRALSFLEKFPSLLEKKTADITVYFHHDGDLHKTVLNLPTPYPLQAFEAAEIVGVIINLKDRRSEKKPQASVSIQRTAGGAIHNKIDFNFKISGAEDFFSTVLSVSLAISKKFIRKKQGEKKKKNAS